MYLKAIQGNQADEMNFVMPQVQDRSLDLLQSSMLTLCHSCPHNSWLLYIIIQFWPIPKYIWEIEWMVFLAKILHCRAILGQGQPGLMRWILFWMMPLVQDLSLGLLTSSPTFYHCTTDAPCKLQQCARKYMCWKDACEKIIFNILYRIMYNYLNKQTISYMICMNRAL